MTIKNALFLGTALALFVPSNAGAYVLRKIDGDICQWETSSKNVYLWSESFPAGEWRDAAENAVSRFNRNPSNMRLDAKTRSVGSNPMTAFILGGIDVLMTDDEDWIDSDDAGTTDVTCDDEHMLAANIILNADTDWTADEVRWEHLEYGGYRRPIRSTLLHEFAHAVGLLHEDDEYNLMGSSATHVHANGDLVRAYLGEDVATGLLAAYDLRLPVLRDVSVVHWRYDYSYNGLSQHRKTEAFTSDGSPLAMTPGTLDNYLVTPGQAIRVEFTYENQGGPTETDIEVAFYLSFDRSISPSDREIGRWVIADMARGNVYTTKRTVTIPEGIPTDTRFWIGVMIDEPDDIPEPDNHNYNNVTYLDTPFKIRP